MWSIVEERKFRANLYCRLNVFPMTLPPLRKRGDDITLVTEHFVEKYARRMGKSIEGIADGVMEALKAVIGQAISGNCKTSSSAA
jgi:formate hydrogenlyase transcriptional activator